MLLEKSVNPVDQEYAKLDVYWDELISRPGHSVLAIAGDHDTRGFARKWLDQKHRLDKECQHYIELIPYDDERAIENESYGRYILQAMAQSKEQRDELIAKISNSDTPVAWQPKLDLNHDGYTDVTSLAYNCEEFIKAHSDYFNGLVIAIEFTDADQFQSWLFDYINIADTKNFYIIALISEQKVIEIESEKLLRVNHTYDPHALLRKVVDAYNDGSPAGELRAKMVAISQAEPAYLEDLEQLKSEALAIVDDNDWPLHRLSLHILAANKWFQLSCERKALDDFNHAITEYDAFYERFKDKAEDESESKFPESSFQLKIQGCFGAAMIHKLRENYIEAGEFYGKAAGEADVHDHHVFSYMGHTFAAQTYEICEDDCSIAMEESPAVAHSIKAFAALSMLDDPKKASTPPEVFIDTTMRLSKRHGWEDLWPEMTKQMAAVFGADALEAKYKELR